MKKFITSLLSCFAVVLLMVPIAHAQTPDAQTPANEGVCDVLTDGATKGLYGLCIAFCEAQDHTSLDAPITGDDLEAMMDIKPAGKILANYNKKKTDNDPPMPCINYDALCPCWTADELASIDFTMFDGAPAHPDGRDCNDEHYPHPINDTTTSRTRLQEWAEEDITLEPIYTTATVIYNSRTDANGDVYPFFGGCSYTENANNVEGVWRGVSLWLQASGSLTPQQLEYCHSSLHGQLEKIRASCTTGNQAPGQ